MSIYLKLNDYVIIITTINKITIVRSINFLIKKEKIILLDNIKITYSNIYQNHYLYILNILISKLMNL